MTITEDLHMLLYVALGGALGSVGRYLVAGSLKGVGGTDFPWHMIAVNTLGCILVGFFVAVLYVKLRFFVKFWGAKVSMHSWRGHALNTVRVLFRCVC